MAKSIHINPVAPQRLVMLCPASIIMPDMTLVLSSVIKMKKPNGAVLTLDAVISAQTTDSLTLTHLFPLPNLPSEVDRGGIYKVYPLHTLAVGEFRGETDTFTALDSFE